MGAGGDDTTSPSSMVPGHSQGIYLDAGDQMCSPAGAWDTIYLDQAHPGFTATECARAFARVQ